MKCNNCDNGIVEPFTTLGDGSKGYACNICGDIVEDKGFDSNDNVVWMRLGANVKLPKSVNDYPDKAALIDAIITALKGGNFELSGDSYIPTDIVGNSEEIGFEV